MQKVYHFPPDSPHPVPIGDGDLQLQVELGSVFTGHGHVLIAILVKVRASYQILDELLQILCGTKTGPHTGKDAGFSTLDDGVVVVMLL